MSLSLLISRNSNSVKLSNRINTSTHIFGPIEPPQIVLRGEVSDNLFNRGVCSNADEKRIGSVCGEKS
jgi:hypothetical protein